MTEEQELYFLFEELNWKKSLPSFTLHEIVNTFPNEKKMIREMLQNQINKARSDLEEANKLEQETEDIIYRKCPKGDEWFWRALFGVLFTEPLHKGKEQTIKRNTIFLSTKRAAIDSAAIARAKQHPITEFIEFKGSMARCPFHSEKSASFHYYKESNTTYCFGGCGKAFDVIDIYQKLYNCTFIEAVKKLQ